ncbi:MFS transporter [Streptomyces sp. NPDC059452]|uniref:MFS transporter n=1 Tax=Streptomyces sp. NPDC059452 TaxID=3346835 RepID=UPI0036BA4D89
MPSFDIWVARKVPAERLAKAMGAMHFFRSAGNMVGSLLAGALFDLSLNAGLPGANWYVAGAVAAVCAAACLLSATRRTGPTRTTGPERGRPPRPRPRKPPARWRRRQREARARAPRSGSRARSRAREPASPGCPRGPRTDQAFAAAASRRCGAACPARPCRCRVRP